jgi:hypothetical protein
MTTKPECEALSDREHAAIPNPPLNDSSFASIYACLINKEISNGKIDRTSNLGC